MRDRVLKFWFIWILICLSLGYFLGIDIHFIIGGLTVLGSGLVLYWFEKEEK